MIEEGAMRKMRAIKKVEGKCKRKRKRVEAAGAEGPKVVKPNQTSEGLAGHGWILRRLDSGLCTTSQDASTRSGRNLSTAAFCIFLFGFFSGELFAYSPAFPGLVRF